MSWPTPAANRLIDAMVVAEGGPQAFVRAVRCSMPCRDYAEARQIAANTVAHAFSDFIFEPDNVPSEAFVRFLGARWAPVGAKNDPNHLNEHWVPNVLSALRKNT